MARSKTGGSLSEVRDSIKRIRGEGERFLGQLRRETQAFARKTRSEVTTDVRKVRDDPKVRGEQALRDLEARGRRIVERFEKQVGRLADAAGNRSDNPHLNAPELTARVRELRDVSSSWSASCAT